MGVAAGEHQGNASLYGADDYALQWVCFRQVNASGR